MKWEKKYDGGLYEGTRPDGTSAKIIKMGVGQKGWTVNGTYYSVKVGAECIGSYKYLKAAKEAAAAFTFTG